MHGLGGGSRKTWSATEQIDSFWPREWLPYETGFKRVRIHSFGYDADWSSRKSSPLTIQDFGQALLADISNSQHLKRNPDVCSAPFSQHPISMSPEKNEQDKDKEKEKAGEDKYNSTQ